VAAFYLDEDVPLRLARLLIDRGHFAVTTDDEPRGWMETKTASEFSWD
jgi:hypothetical protein